MGTMETAFGLVAARIRSRPSGAGPGVLLGNWDCAGRWGAAPPWFETSEAMVVVVPFGT